MIYCLQSLKVQSSKFNKEVVFIYSILHYLLPQVKFAKMAIQIHVLRHGCSSHVVSAQAIIENLDFKNRQCAFRDVYDTSIFICKEEKKTPQHNSM